MPRARRAVEMVGAAGGWQEVTGGGGGAQNQSSVRPRGSGDPGRRRRLLFPSSSPGRLPRNANFALILEARGGAAAEPRRMGVTAAPTSASPKTASRPTRISKSPTARNSPTPRNTRSSATVTWSTTSSSSALRERTRRLGIDDFISQYAQRHVFRRAAVKICEFLPQLPMQIRVPRSRRLDMRSTADALLVRRACPLSCTHSPACLLTRLQLHAFRSV